MADPRLLVDSRGDEGRASTKVSEICTAQHSTAHVFAASVVSWFSARYRSTLSSDRELQQGPCTASLLPTNTISVKAQACRHDGLRSPQRRPGDGNVTSVRP